MSRDKDTTRKVLQQVEQTITAHQLLQPSDKVLVALSGGADSVALLLLLRRLCYKVEALHCNFHLRGEESDRDENFVRDLCREQSVTLFVRDFDTLAYAKEQHVSVEMAARDLRYDWFEQMRQERQASCIAVAHHQQDQAETLLLHLLRGSGLRGLAGMHYRRDLIIRPLLDVSREDLVLFLQENGQTWVEDSTNREREALRNRIRLDILPLLREVNPQAVAHLAQTARHVQQALPYYEKGLAAEHGSSWDGWTVGHGSWQEGTSADAEVTIPLEAAILHERIRGCGFTQSQERDILQARTGALVTSSTHRLLRDRHAFVLQAKDVERPLPEVIMEVCPRWDVRTMQKGKAYFDNRLVAHPLTVRPVRTGDRMVPFGMKGSRLVSDILTDLRLNLFQKERQQLVTDAQGRILCLPGLRSSNLCPVTEATEEVLVIYEST